MADEERERRGGIGGPMGSLYEAARAAIHQEATALRIDGKMDELVGRYEQALTEVRQMKIHARAILDSIPHAFAVRVREGGGMEDEMASLTVSVRKLLTEIERLTQRS